MSALAAALLAVLAGWALRPRAPSRRSAPAERPSRRRRPPTALDLADYLGAVARELRAGGTVTAAFLTITPDHAGGVAFLPAWRRVVDGAALLDALRTDPPDRRRGRFDTDVAGHALACAATVGGSPAVAIDAAASVLREREAVAADARAHSAQARLSGRVLTIVPLAFASWSAATDARVRTTYTSSAAGVACVAGGLVLNLAGWWWMRRIVANGGGR